MAHSNAFLLYSLSLKGKDSPYSIAERRVPELTPVLGSQPASDMSHKSGGRLPLLYARPAVTLATLQLLEKYCQKNFRAILFAAPCMFL